MRSAFGHLYYQLIEIENQGNVLRRKSQKPKEPQKFLTDPNVSTIFLNYAFILKILFIWNEADKYSII